jgi:hypothetical protein
MNLDEITKQLQEVISDMKTDKLLNKLTFDNAHMVAARLVKNDYKSAKALFDELKIQLRGKHR